jgi:Leucine-rich repeat (LRR) protein
MSKHKWFILERINLSNNLIIDIDILNNYPNLKIIKANNCFIGQVNLSSLKNLKLLDLNSN